MAAIVNVETQEWSCTVYVLPELGTILPGQTTQRKIERHPNSEDGRGGMSKVCIQRKNVHLY